MEFTITTIKETKYDALLCAVGYESRSKFVANEKQVDSASNLGIGFDYHQIGSLEENVEWFLSNGFFKWNNGQPAHISDASFPKTISQMLSPIFDESNKRPHFAVDISSFSSIRLAEIVKFFWNQANEKEFMVDFLYAPGRHYMPSRDDEQIQFAGPVTDQFAGWSSAPELPVVAIFGLGLRDETALGAFEFINPGDAYTFATAGAENSLREQIDDANKELYPLVPKSHRHIFDVARPIDCFNSLRSLVSGSIRHGRPILVPLGPKIFTLCSLLIANEFFPHVGVWRVSVGRTGTPRDVIERGDISGLSVTFFQNE